jgi:hypothetical protein
VENLKDNIKALSIHLTDEHIKQLESVVSFDIGFPMNFIGDPIGSGLVGIPILQNANLEYQRAAKPIGHQ